MQAEALWAMNGLMCLCAFLLGGKMAGISFSSLRNLFLSSVLGGSCSLGSALLPTPLWLLGFPLALRLCFGRRRCGETLRAGLMVLAALVFSGGAVYLFLSAHAAPELAFCVAAGGEWFLWLLLRLTTLDPGDVRQIELRWQGRSLILPAMADSGNLLRDVVTGLPVIVAPLRAACRLQPDLTDWYRLQLLPEGFRLMKVRTAAGSCLMPLFKPDQCHLYLNGKKAEVRVMIAVSGPEYTGVQALVPTSALREELCAEVSPSLAKPLL